MSSEDALPGRLAADPSPADPSWAADGVTATRTVPPQARAGAEDRPVADLLAVGAVSLVAGVLVAALIGYAQLMAAVGAHVAEPSLGTVTAGRWTGILLVLSVAAVVGGLGAVGVALHRIGSRSDRAAGVVTPSGWQSGR